MGLVRILGDEPLNQSSRGKVLPSSSTHTGPQDFTARSMVDIQPGLDKPPASVNDLGLAAQHLDRAGDVDGWSRGRHGADDGIRWFECYEPNGI